MAPLRKRNNEKFHVVRMWNCIYLHTAVFNVVCSFNGVCNCTGIMKNS